ncbi:uncharacterized protein FIBRA_00214 [Fibroporia radiculosa]|uniref:Uncharacterized protein n=1 Tax=Fibroporia radiculosa TaxID=599839 RepID=J7RV63_9APHY|nr:uncharacterized protein FIBRA_00214 [Fibroporia radiculosa]CCL98220.1 predicted protein [Fibroporia radiculosa]
MLGKKEKKEFSAQQHQPDVGPVHEKSKKAGAHCVSPRTVSDRPVIVRTSPIVISRKYWIRREVFLLGSYFATGREAQGIMPLDSHEPSEPVPKGKIRKRAAKTSQRITDGKSSRKRLRSDVPQPPIPGDVKPTIHQLSALQNALAATQEQLQKIQKDIDAITSGGGGSSIALKQKLGPSKMVLKRVLDKNVIDLTLDD